MLARSSHRDRIIVYQFKEMGGEEKGQKEAGRGKRQVEEKRKGRKEGR